MVSLAIRPRNTKVVRKQAVGEEEPDYGRVFVQGQDSTIEDRLKQKHTTAMWTSLTEGRKDHYDLESEVGDQRLQREDT